MLQITQYILVLVFLAFLSRECYVRIRSKPAHNMRIQTPISATPHLEAKLGEETQVPEHNVIPLYATLEDSKPTPYRPFRYGPKYAINMGIRALDFDKESWIEVDNHFRRYQTDKIARLESANAEKLWGSLPGSEDACLEVFELISDYLPKRYPKIYQRTSTGMAVAGCEHVDFAGVHPLVSVSKMIQDDIAIMIEGQDGQYYLRAGSILLAGFWKLEDKLGMSLPQIHNSGDVPHYQTKLQASMDRYISKLKVDKPIVRNNYFIQNDASLPWSKSIGEEFPAEGHHEPIGWDAATTIPTIHDLHFRSERQSLRRLPRSKAILFTIRTYIHPIVDLVKEPNVPGRLASAVRSWDEDVRRYKGYSKYCDILLPYLDECHQEQVRSGVTTDEPVEHKYPF